MLSHVIDRLSHRISCDEATSAFTLHYSLVHCAYSFLNMLSEGSIVLLSRHDASQATRLESFTSVGLSSTRCSVLILDTPICHLKKYILLMSCEVKAILSNNEVINISVFPLLSVKAITLTRALPSLVSMRCSKSDSP